MTSSLLKKFRLKEGMKVRTLNAPPALRQVINDESAGIIMGPSIKDFHQVHCFVKTKKDLENSLSELRKLYSDNVVFWIFYPKGTSKIQTDLTRDNGWEMLLKEPGLRWLNLVSLDSTWSAFGFRYQDGGEVKQKAPIPGPVSAYIDPSTKTVHLPAELEMALQKEPEVAAFFHQLAFTHRKEYVEWIVTAKKEETKARRIEETIKRLKAKWKNPRNL